jgi:hypothetical protein
MHRIAELDPRSLACLRVGLAIALLWDMGIALVVADDWWPMQGHEEMPLPAALVFGSPATTLRLSALGVAAAAVCLGLGWRTRWMSIAAWVGACAHQYASLGTADYHNAALCTLFLWALALPLGERWSLDARAGRRPRQAPWLALVGGGGLVLSLAWIYLYTAGAKTGDAWWDGSAVWLALLDRATETGFGRWVAGAAPALILRAMTWGVLAAEWLAPLLIVWPRARWVACCLLAVLHGAMWPLMNLGSFPFVMLVGAIALIPSRSWDGGLKLINRALVTMSLSEYSLWRRDRTVAVDRMARDPAGSFDRTRTQRWLDRITLAVLIGAIVVTLESHRLATDHGEAWSYPGAGQVTRARNLLGLEVRWMMYAPDPLSQTGWWVAIAWRADGRVIDPISGAAPRLAPPAATGAVARLRWLFLSQAPHRRGEDSNTGYTYRDFLLERRNGEGPAALKRLALVWIYEPLIPYQTPARRQPLLVLSWPAGAVTEDEVSRVLGGPVSRPRYSDSGRLVGPADEPCAPTEQSGP